jgi:DNA-binding transcriptional LysR family regulator
MDEHIDLNSLMLFYEVIEAGSLTAASAKLKVAKSTVSRRLNRLEQQFGLVLIKKSARKLVLTEVGANLHKRCQTIAAEVHKAGQQMLGMRSNMQGTLRISVPGDLGVTWLGKIICDFAQLSPNLTISLRMHNSDVVDLIKEPFDIAIQIGEMKPSQLVCKHLATLSRGIYASPEYVARRGTPDSLDDCRAHDWIITDVQERDGIWLLRRHSKRNAMGVAPRVVANSARLARELAIMGLGLALVPNVLCMEAVRDQRLIRLLTQWQSPPLQIMAVFLSRDRIPGKTRAFLEFFAERMKVMATQNK